MSSKVGMSLVVLGLCVVVAGVLIVSGALAWFGRLPGDLNFGSERVRVHIPFASMLLVSIVLSLILYLLRCFF